MMNHQDSDQFLKNKSFAGENYNEHSRVLYFGAGHPGVIHLTINLPHDEEIRMSNFGWIRNHYKIIGNGADPLAEKFWNKLKRIAKSRDTNSRR